MCFLYRKIDYEFTKEVYLDAMMISDDAKQVKRAEGFSGGEVLEIRALQNALKDMVFNQKII